MNIQLSAADKLRIVEMLYDQEYQADVNERSINKIIMLAQNTSQTELRELESRLQELEIQYQMSSEDFYRKFQNGELGDGADFFEWSAFYDMQKDRLTADNLKKCQILHE